MLEFNAGIVCCEPPIGFGVVFVAVFFPSRDFFDQAFPVGNAAVEALGQRDAQFGFGHPSIRSATIGLGHFGGLFGGPWWLSGQHGVGEDAKLPRASDKGESVGFASDFQACIPGDQSRIPWQCGAPDERRHGKIQPTSETARQAATRCLDLAAMRLFTSDHFHDFLDRADEKLIHLPTYLMDRYIDPGAVEVGADGFENLARAVFLGSGSDEAACVIFRRRAGLAELSGGPKSKPFVAPRPRLEFQFFVMGEFRFESMLPLVESRHDTPHGTVASPHLGGNFDNSNILRKRHA
jgi:hypothetical protein